VIDVDGSYLYRKLSSKITSATSPTTDNIPDITLVGWKSVEGTPNDDCNKIPIVTHGTFILYLTV
jgi:hypothetical protein